MSVRTENEGSQQFASSQAHHVSMPQPPPQGGATAVPTMMAGPPQMPNLKPLRSQIEFYFSTQNLVRDKYLLAQLSSPNHLGAVPMTIICSFPKVRQIHSFIFNLGHLPMHMKPMADPFVVRSALHQSSVVTVSSDGNWVVPTDSSWQTALQKQALAASTESTNSTVPEESKPATSAPSSPSSQATASSSLGIPTHPLPPPAVNLPWNGVEMQIGAVIMVRDAPADATAKELMEVLRPDTGGGPNTARTDGANNWFVSFDGEAQAARALTLSRDRRIRGMSIQGQILSQHPFVPAEMGQVPPYFGTVPQHNMAPSMVPPHAFAQGGHTVPVTQNFYPSYGFIYAFSQQMPTHQQPKHYSYPQGQGYTGPQYFGGYPVHGRLPTVSSDGRHGSKQMPRNNYYFKTNRNYGNPNHNNNHNHKFNRMSPHAPQQQQPNQTNSQAQTRKNGSNREETYDRKHIGKIATPGSQKPMGGTKEWNHQSKNKKRDHAENRPPKPEGKQNGDPIIKLGDEHFPALGGHVPKNNSARTVPVSGYAEALRKKPSPPVTPVKTPTVVNQVPPTAETTLNEVMSKLAFSEETTEVTAYDDW